MNLTCSIPWNQNTYRIFVPRGILHTNMEVTSAMSGEGIKIREVQSRTYRVAVGWLTKRLAIRVHLSLIHI